MENTEVWKNEDWFLQWLVNLVNGTELRLPITLNVGGLVVSGMLTSGHKYFKYFSETIFAEVKSENTNDGINKVRNYINDLGNVYIKDSEQINASQLESDDSKQKPVKPDPIQPSYIHIMDARFYHNSGQPIPSNQGVFWRGKISSVDAFTYGSLSVAQNS